MFQGIELVRFAKALCPVIKNSAGVMAANPDGRGFNAKFDNFLVNHVPDQRRLNWLKENN
ncbi:hypothetical protein ASG22_01015 [Chryseobacterium sp. Leaf405]|nr:hypothetical protein ASG22_01015 [Chryseobacterium sp. Leaf405]